MIDSSNYDEAIRVMQCAAAVPKNLKINYHDHVRTLFSCHKHFPDYVSDI